MITRLEVDGFKSLRDFAIDLEPFTVLVGPNDAGKSNILEALALAARLGDMSAEDALKHGRGRASDQFSRHAGASVSRLSLAVETLDFGYVDPATIELERRAYRERNEIVLKRSAWVRGLERLERAGSGVAIDSTGDRWLAAHPEWRPLVGESKIDAVYDYTPDIDLIQLHASQLREPSERIDSGKLAADASNLPSVLAALTDLQLGRIRAAFVGLVPGISDFDIVPHDDSLEVVFHTREGEEVPARLASDGTLRMLGLLTAVFATETGTTVVCIEEPENGIYPGRLARLIELLREATDDAAWRAREAATPPPQVLLTTHSPVALAALRKHPEVLRFVDTVRRDGLRYTRARRVVAGAAVDRHTEASIKEIELLLRSVVPDEER